MSQKNTKALFTNLKRNATKFLKHNKLRVMPTAKYSPNVKHNQFLDVNLSRLPYDEYQLTFYQNQEEKHYVELQFLPWLKDSGIYMELQSEPGIWFTDKLTGCYLAFGEHNDAHRVVHLNFQNYSEMQKRKTLRSYEHYHLFSPEQYKNYTYVFGLYDNGWTFYFQSECGEGKVKAGKIKMITVLNKYFTRSTKLEVL